MLPYLDRVEQLIGDTLTSIALCELAMQDTEVVLSHADNSLVIGGRWRTRFKSAFVVKGPVYPEQILTVGNATASNRQIDVSTRELWDRSYLTTQK